MRSGKIGGTSASCTGGDSELFPSVEIDTGTFKYVLIEARSPDGSVHNLVRGDARAEYHKDAAAATVRQMQRAGWSYEVLGGGRIRHEPAAKKALVYGFSYGFPWDGMPRHDVTVSLLQEAYPDYSVSASNEGY